MDRRLLVQCGHCGARYKIDPRLEGRKAKCKRCRNVFRLTPKVSLDDTVMDWLEDENVEKQETGGSPSLA